jgi:hypothetical protein
MTTLAEHTFRFVPSAVQGLPAVTEVTVFPDRLELLSEGKVVVIRFRDIAWWHGGGWLQRPLARLGFQVRGWPSVADRDWFHPPAGRFFRFLLKARGFSVFAGRTARRRVWRDDVPPCAECHWHRRVQHLRPRVIWQAEPECCSAVSIGHRRQDVRFMILAFG